MLSATLIRVESCINLWYDDVIRSWLNRHPLNKIIVVCSPLGHVISLTITIYDGATHRLHLVNQDFNSNQKVTIVLLVAQFGMSFQALQITSFTTGSYC